MSYQTRIRYRDGEREPAEGHIIPRGALPAAAAGGVLQYLQPSHVREPEHEPFEPDVRLRAGGEFVAAERTVRAAVRVLAGLRGDRKSTRLNSSHLGISYAVFC